MNDLNCSLDILDNDLFLIRRRFAALQEEIEEFFDENVVGDLYTIEDRVSPDTDTTSELDTMFSDLHAIKNTLIDVDSLIYKAKKHGQG